MKNWIRRLMQMKKTSYKWMLCFLVLGAAPAAFSADTFFYNTAAGIQWSDADNWDPVGLPNGTDSDVSIQKVGVVVSNGVAALAWNMEIGAFNRAASVIVETGGSLYSKEGIKLGPSNSEGVLDVSGALSLGVGRSITMGSNSGGHGGGTIYFRDGGSFTTSGNIQIGEDATAGDFTVDQSGGTISVGEILIGDTDGSTCSGTYSISGGTLSAARLNTGGTTATSTPKFSVDGDDATISFSATSYLSGNTELEFIFDATGVSTLDMTGGGYSVGESASITVNAAAFAGADGTEFELININSGGSLDVFATENLFGGSLEYRADDGLYFVTAPPPTIPSTNLWDESFAGTTFDDSWTEHETLSTIAQSNALFMTPDNTSGFASGFLATDNSQAQSSGDPAVTFNGNPAYNFYNHDLEITIDGLSMPRDVTSGNLLFITGVSGDPVASSTSPRQYLPGAFLRVNSSSTTSGLLILRMFEGDGTAKQVSTSKDLNALPDSMVLTMNADGWNVEITGTTFTDGTTTHSEGWGLVSSTVFDTDAVLIVGSYNENIATTTSGSREMSISHFEVNAMETIPPVVVPGLFINSAADFVTVSATGLTATATYSLDSSISLVPTNWTSAAVVTGVSETNWSFSATNSAMFYRLESQ